MHAQDLVEVAVVIGSRQRQSPPLIEADSHIHNYWVASRSRMNAWHESLQIFAAYVRAGGTKVTSRFPQAKSIIHEILISEILTRVWAAETQFYDALLDTNQFVPIARNVFNAHLEARHRTLSLMTFGVGFPVDEMLELNRLRRSCERWTDMLLGNYPTDLDLEHLAFDAHRVIDFAAEKQKDKPNVEQQWRLLAASARVAFQVHSPTDPATPQANRQIAQSIAPFAKTLPPVTLPERSFVRRIDAAADEAQKMLDSLLLLDR